MYFFLGFVIPRRISKESANEALLTSINATFESTGYECLFQIILGCAVDDGAGVGLQRN